MMSNISGALREELDKVSFEINDVVQINERGPEGWIGCLAFVEKVKDIKLMIGIQLPKQGIAYLFIKSDQVEKIGKMVLIKE